MNGRFPLILAALLVFFAANIKLSNGETLGKRIARAFKIASENEDSE